jgi:hypothetical protein
VHEIAAMASVAGGNETDSAALPVVVTVNYDMNGEAFLKDAYQNLTGRFLCIKADLGQLTGSESLKPPDTYSVKSIFT